MFARSVLASMVCVLVGVVASAGGCATGGDSTLPNFDASGDVGGDTTQPGMCAKPKIECGKACIDPTTDNDNCGACNKHCPKGEVCSSSKCGLVCTGGTTLCTG